MADDRGFHPPLLSGASAPEDRQPCSMTRLVPEGLNPESHFIFSQFFDASDDAISYIDHEYRYVFLNTKYEKHFGLNRDDIIGQTVYQLFGKKFFEKNLQARLDRCLQGEHIHFEEWFDMPARGWRFMSVTYNPLQNISGDIIGVLHISRDVTELKKKNIAISEERDVLNGVLSSLDTGLSLIDKDMTICWVNEHLRAMFPHAEPLGKRCHEFFEENESTCEECGTIQAFATGKRHQTERYNKRDDKWYSIVAQPVIDEDGEVMEVLEGITDITERKKSEEALRNSEARFKRLVDNAQDAFFLSDITGRIIDANVQAMLDTGYSRKELMEMYVWDIDTKLTKEDFTTLWREAPEGHLYYTSTHHKNKKGVGYPVELSVTKFSEGGETFLFGIARNAMERKEFTEALKRSEAKNA